MHVRHRIETTEPGRTVDAGELRWIMTVHNAAFDKLVEMHASSELLSDLFEDMASTYGRAATQLRRRNPS